MVAKKHQQLVNQIETALANSRSARKRAILLLYEAQTLDEQSHQTTKHHNNVGFGASDARLGTVLARKIISGKAWTEMDDWNAGRIARKYSKTQLLKLAIAKSNRDKNV